MIVVDTDVFIDFFRNQQVAVEFFRSASASEISFSAITEAEILSGKECDHADVRGKVLHFLSGFTKCGVDNRIAQTAGFFRRTYGLTLGDSLIAATAFHSQAALCTRNKRDFEKVREITVKGPS